ncbi:hypothetical protein Sru01_35400 [Sphaerisporangium rufum]|uniref:MFS transporter n=1 Tax=Sphaerisporangium rufum TaxID=1381558 RepID=A0A919R3D2_9ACTN|nr:MFS transporter [Sphaerisporangium rufum]GII78558.1 hypothetical protein Sru01_35400 [Sphaerisporangium rufum]
MTGRGGAPLTALALPGYRAFIASQALGNAAMWMHRTTHVWLVVQITKGDGVAVGVVTGLQFIPMIVLGLGGGALGDRFDKRRMMLLTQSAVVLAAAVLALLVARGAATLPIAYAFALLLGVPGALDAPVRLAYPRQLVPSELLAPAVGVNGAVFQLARVAGPALAGGLIAWHGTATVFAAVAVLGAGACAALWRVRPPPAPDPVVSGGAPGLRGRWRRAYLVPMLGGFLLGVGIAHLQLAVPLLLDPTARGAAGTFGMLTAMIGLGGVAGAGLVTVTRGASGDRGLLWWSAAFCAVTVAVAALPTGLAMGAGLFLAGVTMQIFGTSAISALQLRSPADVQGRLMAWYVIVFFLWAPVGGPVFGRLAGLAGVRPALAGSGLACLAVALLGLAMLRPGRPGDRGAPRQSGDRRGIT